MIGIVGGGVSGLFLLHFLRERGEEAILFEASELPGGVMQSRTVPGPHGPVTVDLGPQRMRLTRGIAEIVDALQLTGSLLRAQPGIPFMIHRAGRLIPAPMTFGDAFRTPLISWPGKLRALNDLFSPGPAPEESVADVLTRKLGPEVHSRLAGPLLGGLYASDPRQMQARHTLLPAMARTGRRRSLLLALRQAAKWDRVPVISFREGMGSLPLALAERHAQYIRSGAPVREIAHGPRPGAFEIRTYEGSHSVDEAVLALPAPEAARVVQPVSSDLAASLGSLRYNPLGVVPLAVPADRDAPEIGSGFKMTLMDTLHTRGVTAHAALFGRKGLFTAFLGGMGDEALFERTDGEILEIAAREFRAVTGVDAVPLLVHRTRMPAWDQSWSALDDLTLPTGMHVCAAFGDRPGVAGRLEDARRTAARLAERRA